AVAAAILDQRVLHDAHQRAAIGRNRQTFHALVVYPAEGVGGIAGFAGGEFALTRRGGDRYKETVGQLKRPSALAGITVEFVDVRPVLIGDVDVTPVIRDAQAFRVITGIVGIARVLCGIEIV